jgi:3-hydroxyisobutyrate dehydrogenase
MSATLPTVAFIGIGKMGWHMAGHLVRAGYRVLPLDVNPEMGAQFAAEHKTAIAEPADFADASIIVTMLPTSADVAEALLGESSTIRPFLAAGALVIDMSSSQPLETQSLGEQLAAVGVHVVDAPVSGGTAGAEKGTLTIMLGADSEEDAQRALPIVEAVSARVFRVGKLGAGHALKSLNNFVAAAGFIAATEALIAAQEYGLDPNLFLDVLSVSTGRNFSTEMTLKLNVVPGTYDSGFPLALMTKDVKIANELAHQLGTRSTMRDAVVAQLSAALGVLGNDPAADHALAAKVWQEEK